jgi:DNA-binding NtrC family response regulator
MKFTTSGGMLASTPAHGLEAVAWASPAMRSLELDIVCARTLDCNVMISGESGVGKKAVAHRLYRESGRQSRPLVIMPPLHALSSEDSLTECLRAASPDSTILLEEPQRTSPSVQSRLLQLVERRARPVATRAGIVNTHDVRFLTITNCDLFELVRRDQFCESLFYRLNPIHLVIPPLRARPEDIAVLLEHFFSIYARAARPRLSAEAWHQVMTYTWPGNLRELNEVAATLVARELPGPFEPDDLPPCMTGR